MHYYAEQSCTAGRNAFFTGMHPLRRVSDRNAARMLRAAPPEAAGELNGRACSAALPARERRSARAAGCFTARLDTYRRWLIPNAAAWFSIVPTSGPLIPMSMAAAAPTAMID